MTTRRIISALTVVGAVAAIVFWFLLRSEADVVRGVFDDVAETFNRERDESPLESIIRAKKLCNFMVPKSFQFGVEDMGGTILGSRQDAVRSVALIRQGRILHIEFADLEIIVGGVDAFVRGTVDCTGCDASFALPNPRVRSFVAQMKKVDGDWLFSKVAVQSK